MAPTTKDGINKNISFLNSNKSTDQSFKVLETLMQQMSEIL